VCVCVCGRDAFDSGCGPTADYRDHNNKFPCCMQGGEELVHTGIRNTKLVYPFFRQHVSSLKLMDGFL
jgi:hypothetical protein